MSDACVICVGELLWDLFPSGYRVLGGAPANVAVHLTSLGVAAALVSRIGDDEPGHAALETLRQRGLPLWGIQRDRTLPTGLAHVHLGTEGRVDYRFNTPAAWDAIEPASVGNIACAVFGTLAQRDARSRRAIREIAQVAAERVYDLNLRPPFADLGTVVESLSLATVVKMNESEASALCRYLDLPKDPYRFAAAIRQRFGPHVACVTCGAQGAWAVAQDQLTEVQGISIQANDPVGAGDAFTAGMLRGLLAGSPWPAILREANELGARVAAKRGAVPQGIT